MTTKHYKNLSLKDIPGEIWKPIAEYEGLYEISNKGRVKSLSRNERRSTNYITKEKILKQTRNGSRGKYCSIGLFKDFKQKRKFVHRLVGAAFKENHKNKPFINHNDGIVYNNEDWNLIWCTTSENIKHAYDVLGFVNPKGMLGKTGKLNKMSIPVSQLNKNGVFVKRWDSMGDAAIFFCENSNGSGKIGQCCRGERGSIYGFKWEYAN